MYICVEGNIGAGKTTFVKRFAEINGYATIYERFSENPFLKLFYENPKEHAFPLEMSFLAERFQQLNDIFSKPDLFSTHFIADYSFLKTLIFAEINLLPEEFEVFKSFHKLLRANLAKPTWYIYLSTETDYALENIKTRNRSIELNIETEYLSKIQNGYTNWLLQQNDIPTLRIDYSKTTWKKLDKLCFDIGQFIKNEHIPAKNLTWK